MDWMWRLTAAIQGSGRRMVPGASVPTRQTSVCKTLLHWCSLSRVCLPSVFQVHFPPVAPTALHWFKKIHSILYWDHSRDRGGRDGLVCGFFVCFCFVLPLHWRHVEFSKPRMAYFLFGGVCCLFYCVLSPFPPAPASSQVYVSFPICSISQSDPKD